MTAKSHGNVAVVPLPATVEEMLARKTMARMTLNDYVDQIHVILYRENEDYQKFLEAVWDEQAVEGALSIDNVKASEIIRQYAVDHHIDYVKPLKLATIVKALNVVLRRYHLSRKERVYEIGGEQVPPAE